MNICIRIPGTDTWSASVSYVTPAIRDAYTAYKERPHYYRETPFCTMQYIVYRPDNDPYLPTYIVRVDDIPSNYHMMISREIHESMVDAENVIPIIDLNDIMVFIVDNPSMSMYMTSASWRPARSYQIWAYRDFMYDRHRHIKKSYMSRDTVQESYISNDRILANQIVTIDVANVSPNIVFNIARNENSSVYFERNDEQRSRVRICDNEYARAGYLGFYTRITMDPGMEIVPPHLAGGGAVSTASSALLSITHLPDPEEITDDGSDGDGGHADQCILCVKYRVNARFSPCEHQVCCGLCYSKMSKNECPVCRAEITRVMNI